VKFYVDMQINRLFYCIMTNPSFLFVQLISRSYNAYDYYGESDAETCLDDESVDRPEYESVESQSSVDMSEVCL
jgi:hypothetical protein